MKDQPVKSTPCKKPADATHIESDGTFWKNENGIWCFYDSNFKKWCHYVGKVDHRFLNKFLAVA